MKSTVSQPQHDLIHAAAHYYDIAFSKRDYLGRCAFLDYISRSLGRGRLESFLEVCCGPAYHVRDMAAKGIRSYGVDRSPEMIAYASEELRRVARERVICNGTQEVDPAGGGPPWGQVVLRQGYPHDFTLPEAVDLGFCPNYSFHYLLTNEEIVGHLVAMAKNLGRGGLYIIELEHPGIFLGRSAGRVETWTVERDGVTVKVSIGGSAQAIDPLSQLRDLEIRLEITENGETRVIRDAAPLRSFTHQELRALVQLSGVFDWVATFGDLSITQPFDASAEARSMVPVLRCSI